MHHAFKLGEVEYAVELSRRASGRYTLHLEDREHVFDVQGDGPLTLAAAGEAAQPVIIATRGDEVFVHLDGVSYTLRYRHPLDSLAALAAGSADDHLLAPMPGSLVALNVTPGQTVSKGEALLVMESMKMETTLVAPRDGVIAAVNFEKGQTFDRDARLLSLEPSA
jgi:3-methylcrotonyl-CoA carboxylase alpha subunit